MAIINMGMDIMEKTTLKKEDLRSKIRREEPYEKRWEWKKKDY